MIRNRSWDKYETILLVDYSYKVNSGELPKAKAVSILSAELRQRATSQGEEIDVSFRNENGISMQMTKMLAVIQHKQGTLSKPPQIFFDMAEIKEDCICVYDVLLRIAKGERVQNMCIKEQFLAWLAEELPASQLAGVVGCISEIESFCMARKILNKPLLETDDLKIIRNVFDTICSNKVFRFTHLTTHGKCRTAITQYYNFLKSYHSKVEHESVQVAGQSAIVEDIPSFQAPIETVEVPDQSETDSNITLTESTPTTDAPTKIFEDSHVNDETAITAEVEAVVIADDRPEENIQTVNISANIPASAEVIEKDAAYFRKAFQRVALRIPTEDRIYEALRKESSRNTYGTTLEYIATQVASTKAYAKALLDSSSWCAYQYGTYKFVEPQYGKEYAVDFSVKMPYAGTCPLAVKYFDELVKDKMGTWAEVYFETLLTLSEDYPDLFNDIAQGKEKTDGIHIVASDGMKLLKRPAEFMDGIFAEIPVSATKVIAHIKQLLTLCNVDFENLVITYTYNPPTEDVVGNSSQEVSTTQVSSCNVATILKQNGVSFTSKDNYIFIERDKISTAVLRKVRADTQVISVTSVMHSGTVQWRVRLDPSVPSDGRQAEKPEESTPEPVAERKYLVEQRENFYVWLRDIQGYAEPTCRSYVSAIKTAERFAREHHFPHTKLFVDDFDEASVTASALRKDAAFIALNTSQHNRFSAAITKYLDFMQYYTGLTNDDKPSVEKTDDPTEPVVPEPGKETQTTDIRYVDLLKTRFENGFRPNSAIDKNRFRVFYQEEYGEALEVDDAQIVRKLEKVGTSRDGRIFAKADADQNDLLSEILNTVEAAFNAGASCIYVESLFARYQDQLAEQLQIFNGDALRDLVLSNSKGYFARFAYIGSYKISPDTEKDVADYMKRSHAPVNYNTLENDLWFIPLEKIKHILVINKAMVNVAQETYYYAPNLPVNASELMQIADLINNALLQKRFVSGPELYELIQNHCPSVAINTADFTSWGLRNALGYLLRDKFNFNGNIICAVGETMTTAQVFNEFCRCRETITTDELKDFANEMETVVYWDSVYEEAVRVSATEFVNKRNFHFDVTAIDNALDGLIGRYASIPSVKLFLHFPPIQVQWNGFVLESFVQGFSKHFKLLHASYGAADCCGAIVRRDTGINEYRDLVVEILAENHSWTTQMDALQILVDEGYQMRRALSGIDKMMTDAKHLRNATKK